VSGYNPIVTTSGSADTAPAGAAKINGMCQLVLGTKLVPAALPAGTSGAPSANDYDPSGNHTVNAASRVDLNASSGDAYVTGLDSTSVGDEKTLKLRNISNNVITLAHQNTDSLAANRFWCPGLGDYLLNPGETITIQYWGGTDNVWVLT
jgi:hypothetical protein